MAIQLDKMTDKGVPANYWKVDSFSLNKQGSNVDSVKITYSLAGYVNRQARDNGSNPLQVLRFTAIGDPNDPTLSVYPNINLIWEKGVLSCSFNKYDTLATPEYQIAILELCNQIITFSYEDAMSKTFSAGIKID